jgi:hypothetical protein
MGSGGAFRLCQIEFGWRLGTYGTNFSCRQGHGSLTSVADMADMRLRWHSAVRRSLVWTSRRPF